MEPDEERAETIETRCGNAQGCWHVDEAGNATWQPSPFDARYETCARCKTHRRPDCPHVDSAFVDRELLYLYFAGMRVVRLGETRCLCCGALTPAEVAIDDEKQQEA